MAGVATAFASGDAIPLLDDAGGGVYTKGRNNTLDIRSGLLGSLYNPNTNSNVPKPGVLAQNTATNGNMTLLPQGTPSQQLTLTAGRAVVPRAGQGAYLLDLTVNQTFTMPSADVSQARYDVVCLASFDKGSFVGDAAHGPNIWVESGTLGGGVPATPTDMLKLYEVFRPANGNAIDSAKITDKRVTTSLTGALRLLGAGESLSTAGTSIGEMRYNGNLVQVWTGTAWQELGSSTGYARGMLAKTVYNAEGVFDTQTETVGDGVGFTFDPARSYQFDWQGTISATADRPYMSIGWRIANGGTVTTSSPLMYSTLLPIQGNGKYTPAHLTCPMSGADIAALGITAGTVRAAITHYITAGNGGSGWQVRGDNGVAPALPNKRHFAVFDTGLAR